MGKRLGATSVALASVLFGACGNDSTTDHRAEALASVKTYIDTQLSMMETCATSLQNHAPAADADGWNLTDDAAAVATNWIDEKRANICDWTYGQRRSHCFSYVKR